MNRFGATLLFVLCIVPLGCDDGSNTTDSSPMASSPATNAPAGTTPSSGLPTGTPPVPSLQRPGNGKTISLDEMPDEPLLHVSPTENMSEVEKKKKREEISRAIEGHELFLKGRDEYLAVKKQRRLESKPLRAEESNLERMFTAVEKRISQLKAKLREFE